MLTQLPKYDELYVISDIHMGGTKNTDRNFQIFNRGLRLGKLIAKLTKHRPKDDICLVLNGDIIDSLAEDQVKSYVALDPEVVLAVLDRIYNDPSFACVWDALAAFIKKPQRHLVFIIGNHDIELSLPGVEASIQQRLAGKEVNALSRLTFSTHGSGFACCVGNKRVFCTHGNEVDDWNIVNYDLLGQLGNAMNAGRSVDSDQWKPNAGTRLVVDAMNHIKEQYPFVDLLKPETEPVLGILLTLDKKVFKNINLLDVFPILRDKIWAGRKRKNLLSTGVNDFSEPSNESLANEAIEQLLGSNLRKAIGKTQAQTDISEDELLAATEEAITQGITASEVAEGEGISGELGWGDIVAGKIGLIDKVEALRCALQDWLKDDRTFEIDTQDETYHRIIKRISPKVDFVVTGHTHLARAIEFETGRYYFNSGTWIRLLRLSNEVLADSASEAFKKTVWDAFSSGRMSDLDSSQIPGKNGKMEPLLYDRTHVVRISAKNGAVTGDLLHVTGGDSGKSKLKLSSEFNTGQ